MKTKLISLFMAITIIHLPFMTKANANIIHNGQIGDIIWNLDANGTMTLSGEGKLDFTDGFSDQPWVDYRAEITNVVVKSGITSCSGPLFYFCSNIESFSFPDTVEYIDPYFTHFTKRLKNIYVDRNNKNYITLDGNLFTSDMYYMLQYCVGKNEKEYFVPDTVGCIAGEAFAWCYLDNLYIPAYCKQLSPTWGYCYGLININVDPNNSKYSSIDGVLFDKSQQTLLYYPPGKKNIEYAVPDSVNKISHSSFYNTLYSELKKIFVPVSVNYIDDTFESNITDIYYEGSEVQWNMINIKQNNNIANIKIHYNSTGIKSEEIQSQYPSDINSVTINGHGTAYGYFKVTDSDGTPASNKNVLYTIDGGTEKSLKTDSDGYVQVTIENVKASKIYNVKIYGNNITPTEGEIDVNVKPLEFSSSYTGKITKGESAGLSFGAGGSIGKLEAEAELARIGTENSNERAIKLETTRADGKNKLTASVSTNQKTAISAKAGLFADAGVHNDGKTEVLGAEVSAGDVHGKGSFGATRTVSYQNDDFSLSDSGDVRELAKFLLLSLLDNDQTNVFVRAITRFIDSPANSSERGYSWAGSAGAKIGVVEIKSAPISATLGGIDASAVWSKSAKEDKDKNITYKSSVTADVGYKLCDLSIKEKYDKDTSISGSFSKWSGSFVKGSLGLEAKRNSDDELVSFSVSAPSYDSNNYFIKKSTTSNTRKITYTGNAAEDVVSKNDNLTLFANGEKGFLSMSQIKDSVATVSESDQIGSFTNTYTKECGIEPEISASAKLFLSIGGKVGLSGIESYSFERENGLYRNGTVFLQSSADVEHEVDEQFLSVEGMISSAIQPMTDLINSCIETVSGWVDTAKDVVVEAGKATLKTAKNTVTGWKASITKAVESLGTSSILAVEDEFASIASAAVSTTVSEPYIVSVEDNNGNEVMDLSTNPLQLTIEYTDEQLAAAGVEDINDISIYKWDESKCVYINMDGELDESNSCITLDILEPGQYVLAADTYPPIVTEYEASDTGANPEISAYVSDLSGIGEFSFKIDGKELVNEENIDEYYNSATTKFTYPTFGLENGVHTAEIYAADNSGYAMDEPYTIEFAVNTDAPEITSVTEIGKTVTDSLTVSAAVSGENITGVYLNYIESDALGNSIKSSVPMELDGGIYTATAEGITPSKKLSVWVSAYNTYGNGTESNPQTAICVKDDTPALFISDISDNTVTVKIVNNADISVGKAILAVYNDDGTLSSVETQNFADIMKFSVDDVDGKGFNAMLWDINTMRPLANSYSIE